MRSHGSGVSKNRELGNAKRVALPPINMEVDRRVWDDVPFKGPLRFHVDWWEGSFGFSFANGQAHFADKQKWTLGIAQMRLVVDQTGGSLWGSDFACVCKVLSRSEARCLRRVE